MRILGIQPSPTDIIFVTFEENFNYYYFTHKINSSIPESNIIESFYDFLSTYFTENKFDLVTVLQAVTSQFGSPSKLRIKFEAIIQLVCNKKHINCILKSKQSITSFIKKQDQDLKDILCNKVDIKPKKIIYILWLILFIRDIS